MIQILQVIIIIAVILLLLYLGLLLYKIYSKNITKIKTPTGISSLEEITLGDLKQWIFIRSTNQKNPILLFVHGGPGSPLLGMSSSRKYDKELIKHFTVVHWDQRGAGKSYNRKIPIESINLESYVKDCIELIDYLCRRFSTPKVFLVGHSGGTLIGIKTAYRYPDKILAYVGVSQIINDYEQNRIAYEFIVKEAEKSGESKRLAAIKKIGPPPFESPMTFNKIGSQIGHYGGFLGNNSFKQKLKMVLLMFNFVTSPEYSLKEGFRSFIARDYFFTTNALWEEMQAVDITTEIQSINVPIYFFEGKYDMTTPTVLVEKFYDNLEAKKGKNLIIFENSGHLPMFEENELYQDILINIVLKDIEKFND
ncbi:MAG: alpha/beta hydrolase [Candidatus Lokiarchaeota archaeon]|nr:alpha/beta hydrolase [Candidatus Lokiarchaeota archaeon]